MAHALWQLSEALLSLLTVQQLCAITVNTATALCCPVNTKANRANLYCYMEVNY